MIRETIITILIPLLIGLAGGVYGIYFQRKVESWSIGKSIYPHILAGGLLISAFIALLLASYIPNLNFMPYPFGITVSMPVFSKTNVEIPPPQIPFWSSSFITVAVIAGAHLHTTVGFFRMRVSYHTFTNRKIKWRWSDVARPVEYLTWVSLAVGFYKLSHVGMWKSPDQTTRTFFLVALICFEFIVILSLFAINPHRLSKQRILTRPYLFNLFIHQPVAALLTTFIVWI